jgi:hypothetical protein
MKFRAIMLVDLELPDFLTVAEKQLELTEMLNQMKENDSAVVDIAIDVKERRGSVMPDLRSMKLRGA